VALLRDHTKDIYARESRTTTKAEQNTCLLAITKINKRIHPTTEREGFKQKLVPNTRPRKLKNPYNQKTEHRSEAYTFLKHSNSEKR